MTNDPNQALQGAGIQTDQLSDAEREVLTKLSPEEVQTLVSIRKRLAGDDDTAGYVSLPQGTKIGGATGLQGGAISLVPGRDLGAMRPTAGGSVSAVDVTGGLIF